MQGRLKSRVSIPFTTRIVADASAFNSPLFRRSSTPYVTLSHSRILRARLGDDRGAVEGNSRGSHGGECNEPSCDPRYLHPERADRGAVALFPEWQATQRLSLIHI